MFAKKIIIILMLFFIVSINVYCIEYIVNTLDSDNTIFKFNNFRYVNYEGKEAISVDINALVQTSFLGRNIEISKLNLVFYDLGISMQQELRPIRFNSATFGTILNLNSSGEVIETKEDVFSDITVSAVDVDSGESHRGSLLYILPANYALIYGIKYNSDITSVRKIPNQYIDVQKDELTYSFIHKKLSNTKVATEGDVNLLEIFLKMNKFFDLNDSLESAW